MVATVSGSFTPTFVASAPATHSGALDADLAKRQAQLSDWVHCVSASTPEGKARIEKIGAEISTIKAKMKQADQAAPDPAATQPALREAPGVAALGNYLNVYA